MWLVKTVSIVTLLWMQTACTDGHLAVMSIDIGSEFMKIAIVKPGIPMEIITNEDSARKTATMVAIRNGERLFGNPAENDATKFPSTAYWYLTQIVGKKFDDPSVTQYRKRFPYYNLVKDEERGTVAFKVNDELQYTPEELLAMILEKGKSYAETFADQVIKDAVITVPAYYTQAERRAVKLAAELAGLNILQLMSDNAAVALNYGVFRRKQFNSTMTYIMFYDMGATSSVATIVGYQIVKMKEGTRVVENPQLTIKGVGFDRTLGGLEISMRLRDHFAKKFTETKKTKSNVYESPRSMAKLLKEAKRVKKVLSANTEHMAQVEGLLDDEDFKLKVSRTELEEMCTDMFERVTKPIEDALKTSEITVGELTDVILMGGATRIPKIQEHIQTFLNRNELGRSINTDEAAALGAVYQAANLGKGFKVLTFGVKEASIYPVVVEFEKQKNETVPSDEPPKIIKRTLFGRMNPFPQKKVMTFNKHFKDFGFNVTYGELDFMSEEDANQFRKLQGIIHTMSMKGVDDAYAKHTDAQEAKGIKAHFRMDESGLLHLDLVEAVFEKEDKTPKDESTWSKIGDALGGLFGGDEKKPEEGDAATEATGAPESTDPAKGDEKSGEPDQESTDQSQDSSQSDKSDDPLPDATEQTEEQTTGEKEEEKVEETAEQTADNEEQTAEETDSDKKKEKSTDDKKDKKKDSDEKPEDDGEKKSKVVIVKENITVTTEVKDIPAPSRDALKASRKKLADLTAKDQVKKLLEKAKNELESFIYDFGDKLTHPLYEQCSTEEEREKYQKMLSEASDWLYEQEEDTPKEPYIDKLKGMKKEIKKLEFRVRELKERPEALEALESLLNHSNFFLESIKNLTSTFGAEDSIFTQVEVETLEKLINNTIDWKNTTVAEQSKLADHEKPVLLLEDIGSKMQDLDREVKYLINKAKHYKPKPKPKESKNKTASKNETDKETKGTENEEEKEKEEDTTTDQPDVESEIPAPPSEEEEQQEQDEEAEASETEKTEDATASPVEANTHDAGDL